MKARADQEARSKAPFDPVAFKAYISSIRELGEPAVKTLVTEKFLRPYPHLGAFAPWSAGNASDPNRMIQNRAFHALRVWYAMSVNDVLYDQAHWGMFMDSPPYDGLDVIQVYRKWMRDDLKTRVNGKVFNDLDYGKYALARFWQENRPAPSRPANSRKATLTVTSLAMGA